jgi:TRAP-type transport system periplasmic protein
MRKTSEASIILLLLAVLFVLPAGLQAASDKPIELKFSTFIPSQHTTQVQIYEPWGKELEKRTNGRVKVVYYPGETLGKARDHHDMVVRGIADVAMVIPGYTPGRFPLTSVMELPIGIPSATVATQVFWDLYEKHLKKEYADVKVLQLVVGDPQQIHTTKKAIKTMSDLKGIRLRTNGPIPMAVVRSWSASPLNIAVPDLYDSLSKGMAEGAIMNWTGIEDFKITDLFKCHAIVNIPGFAAGIIMNLDTWNRLPSDIQKIIEELSGLQFGLKNAALAERLAQTSLNNAKSRADQIYDLSSLPEMAEKAKPICDAWIADMEKKGLPGKQVFEETVSLVKKYSKQ